MTWATNNLLPVLPEVWLLCATLMIMLIDLFLGKRYRDVSYFASLVTLFVAFILTLIGMNGESSVRVFSNMMVVDSMSSVLKLAMYLGVFAMFVYAKEYAESRGLFRGELFTLTLFSLLGMMVMASSSNFVTLYLGLELLSLSLYSLVALQRDSASSTEAAMKYFILGALASGMLLYGISMIYGATGSLDLYAVSMSISHGANQVLLVFGLVFIVAGIGFKLGSVPFHMWIPDVYHGSSTIIVLLIGSVPKLAAFAFVIRLLVQALPDLHREWQGMLMVLAVLSMGIGNLVAIAQSNLKRMLAYSTISHMGFLLLGILSGTVSGYAASMFYAIIYSLTATASFGVIILLSRPGFEADRLSDLRGLAQRSPWFALMMLFVMFSMAGIPVFSGFFAKFSVIKAVVDVNLSWLAVLAVLFSLIGAFFYLRIVKLMYMDEPNDLSPIVARLDLRILLSLNCLALLLLGLAPQWLLQLCFDSVRVSLGVL